jgi:hypothetical protein
MVALKAGTYTFWALSAQTPEGQKQSVFGETKATLSPGQENQVVIPLSAGASIHGQVLNRQKLPCIVMLQIQAEPFVEMGAPLIRTVRTDEAGMFTLTGLPPDRSLKILFSESQVRSGAAGSDSSVHIILDH